MINDNNDYSNDYQKIGLAMTIIMIMIVAMSDGSVAKNVTKL